MTTFDNNSEIRDELLQSSTSHKDKAQKVFESLNYFSPILVEQKRDQNLSKDYSLALNSVGCEVAKEESSLRPQYVPTLHKFNLS
jgi:hypothetical protein